jgi:hypothetical protein
MGASAMKRAALRTVASLAAYLDRMGSVAKEQRGLLLWGAMLGSLALGACGLAAMDDAEFRVLEKQRCHLATAACGVEVVKGVETKLHAVHELQVARQGAVNA